MTNGKKNSRSAIFTSPFASADLWRGVFPMLHTPRTKTWDGKELLKPQFDIVLAVPKRGATAETCPNFIMLSSMLMQAVTDQWGSWPVGGRWPIENGDDPPKPAAPGAPPPDPNKNAWKKGHWIVKATTPAVMPPKVSILQAGQAVEIPAQTVGGKQYYKSGDYGVFQLRGFTYNQQGNFGVSVGLVMVMWAREGEAIGGGERSVAKAFGDIAGQMAAAGVTGMSGGTAPSYAPPGPPSNVVPFQPVAAPPPGYTQPPMPPAAAPVYTAPTPAPAYAPPGPPTMGPPPGAPALPPFPR